MIIVVLGTPAPQGSKAFKGFRNGKPILVESSDKTLRPWRKAVEMAARVAALDYSGPSGLAPEPFDGPLELLVDFTLPRPPTVKRPYPVTPPDLSKLVRAVEDSLKDAGVYVDDARIVKLEARKFYVGHVFAMEQPGCVITITPL